MDRAMVIEDSDDDISLQWCRLVVKLTEVSDDVTANLLIYHTSIYKYIGEHGRFWGADSRWEGGAVAGVRDWRSWQSRTVVTKLRVNLISLMRTGSVSASVAGVSLYRYRTKTVIGLRFRACTPRRTAEPSSCRPKRQTESYSAIPAS